MSYLVLARKYRPRTFEDLIGQAQVSRTLTRALEIGRLAHAYLFTGPRGVGKTTAARLLAMALSCGGAGPKPCGVCPTCLEVQAGQSVDVIEVDGASNRGINEIRGLRETVKYLPTKNKYKVYIIDEVHALTSEAFNALLKTLEEPPSHVVFIFATTEAHKLPATILSRCQRYDFRRIRIDDIIARLVVVAEQENITVSKDALTVIARQAEGGLRDALGLMDQVIASGGEITLEAVNAALGLINQDLVRKTVASALDGNPALSLKVLDEAYNLGYDFKELGLKALELVRDLTLYKATPSTGELMELTDAEEADFKLITANISLPTLHRHFEAWLKFYGDLTRHPQPRWLMESHLIRLSQMAPLADLANLSERLTAFLEGGAIPVATPAPPPRSLAAALASNVSPSSEVNLASDVSLPSDVDLNASAQAPIQAPKEGATKQVIAPPSPEQASLEKASPEHASPEKAFSGQASPVQASSDQARLKTISEPPSPVDAATAIDDSPPDLQVGSHPSPQAGPKAAPKEKAASEEQIATQQPASQEKAASEEQIATQQPASQEKAASEEQIATQQPASQEKAAPQQPAPQEKAASEKQIAPQQPASQEKSAQTVIIIPEGSDEFSVAPPAAESGKEELGAKTQADAQISPVKKTKSSRQITQSSQTTQSPQPTQDDEPLESSAPAHHQASASEALDGRTGGLNAATDSADSADDSYPAPVSETAETSESSDAHLNAEASDANDFDDDSYPDPIFETAEASESSDAHLNAEASDANDFDDAPELTLIERLSAAPFLENRMTILGELPIIMRLREKLPGKFVGYFDIPASEQQNKNSSSEEQTIEEPVPPQENETTHSLE
jgi:DNA polymerase-3 subunit gamma/tau